MDVLGSTETQQRQLLEFDAQETRDRRRLPEVKSQYQPSWQFLPSTVLTWRRTFSQNFQLHSQLYCCTTIEPVARQHSAALGSPRQHSVRAGSRPRKHQLLYGNRQRSSSAFLGSHFKKNLWNIIQSRPREIFVCPGLWRRRYSACPFQLNTDILMALCDQFCQQIIQPSMGTGRPTCRLNGKRATLLTMTS